MKIICLLWEAENSHAPCLFKQLFLSFSQLLPAMGTCCAILSHPRSKRSRNQERLDALGELRGEMVVERDNYLLGFWPLLSQTCPAPDGLSATSRESLIAGIKEVGSCAPFSGFLCLCFWAVLQSCAGAT